MLYAHILFLTYNRHINNETPTKLLYVQCKPAPARLFIFLVHSLSTEPKFIVTLTWQVQMESEGLLNVNWGKSAERVYM